MKALYSVFLISIIFFVGCSESTKKKEIADGTINEKLVEISIEGMSCMACVAKVKKTLSDLNGVENMNVSLENKNAAFQYYPQKISLDEIKQAINNVGYKASAAKELPK